MRESVDALAAEVARPPERPSPRRFARCVARAGPEGKNPAAVILLSDGFSTSGRDPLEAAREARRKGVRVYTVSLGTPTGSIDVERRDGTVRRRPVPPDTQSLREIARVTKGRAFRAGDQIKLEEVYERLGEEVGTRKEKRQVTSAFAGGALLLLGAGGLMSLRFFGRLP